MHNFKTLAADLTPLLKKTGDSGDTGARGVKPLKSADYSVTTDRRGASPVAPEVVTPTKISGDDKHQLNQLLNCAVTTVTSVTTKIQQEPASFKATVYPLEWHAILADLKQSFPPEWAGAERREELRADAEIFLRGWGDTARRLGWTTLDLFGVHPTAPACRFDVMGLIPLLAGRRVAALTKEGASIQAASGRRLAFRRSDTAGGVLLTEARR